MLWWSGLYWFRTTNTIGWAQTSGLASTRPLAARRFASASSRCFSSAARPGEGRLGVDLAFGREVVERHVSPAAGVAIDDAQKDPLAGELADVPTDALERLVVLAPGVKHLATVLGAKSDVGVGVGTAADQERGRLASEHEHRRLDRADHRVGRSAVAFQGAQVALALLVVRDRRTVEEELPPADEVAELALDHPPPLQVAGLKVEDDPRRLRLSRSDRCRNEQEKTDDRQATRPNPRHSRDSGCCTWLGSGPKALGPPSPGRRPGEIYSTLNLCTVVSRYVSPGLRTVEG